MHLLYIVETYIASSSFITSTDRLVKIDPPASASYKEPLIQEGSLQI